MSVCEAEAVAEQGRKALQSHTDVVAMAEQGTSPVCRSPGPSLAFHWPRSILPAEVSVNTRFLWVNAHFHLSIHY